MKKSTYLELKSNPAIVFFFGMLIGALIIGFIFCYRILNPRQYKSAVVSPLRTTTQSIKKSNVLPKSMVIQSATTTSKTASTTPQPNVPSPQPAINY